MAMVVMLYAAFCVSLGAAFLAFFKKKPQAGNRQKSVTWKGWNRFMSWLGRKSKIKFDAPPQQKLNAMLLKTRGMTAASFRGYQVFLAVMMSAAALIMVKGYAAKIGLMMAGFWAGFALPAIVLRQNIQAINRDILLDLPYILDLLYIATLAGQNIYRAVNIMTQNYEGRISEEFRGFIQDIDLGRGKEAAYQNLIGSPNPQQFKHTLVLLNVAEDCGSNISEILAQKSKQLKFEISQQAERKSRRASLLILFPLAFLILPSFMLMVGGPLLFSLGGEFIKF
ncbi:MAG: type II secretion system F family protein [Actinomycetota bacterium]|nr:type II secretion system F family protein [Actinomycetota bacterium]